MNSISSINSKGNVKQINLEFLKNRALSLLKNENIDKKELLSCCQDLMMIPNLDEDIIPMNSHLLDIDSFEISHKKRVNTNIIRNLLNIIQIINFIWIACKNKIKIFHNTLLNLGIMFSYLYRNEKDDKDGIDYFY